MRESIRTMDMQVEQVLADRHMVGCRYFRSRSLYSRSPTCNVVTKPCESQIGQQAEQAEFYACRIKNRSQLCLKRLPAEPLFCVECEKKKETDDEE
jgi:hypothetical protein